MNASFGIDHPLLATHDIEGLRNRLISLGFNMTAIGKHPWGTSTSLAMFNGCLIEIMGIFDANLIDNVPAGDFRFGRHVYEHLEQREGVALTALHSTQSEADADTASRAGFTVAGHLEFGRDVTLPDGTEGRTRTTLALLPDAQFPRLSFFLCQQHRPEVIYVQEWLQHPNKVTGISAVNIVARRKHHEALRQRLGKLYDGAQDIEDGFLCQTANGIMRIQEPETFVKNTGPLPDAIMKDDEPCIAGMDLALSDEQAFFKCLESSSLPYTVIENGYALAKPELTANTLLRFVV